MRFGVPSRFGRAQWLLHSEAVSEAVSNQRSEVPRAQRLTRKDPRAAVALPVMAQVPVEAAAPMTAKTAQIAAAFLVAETDGAVCFAGLPFLLLRGGAAAIRVNRPAPIAPLTRLPSAALIIDLIVAAVDGATARPQK